MSEEKIIPYDSDEACTKVTLELYKSSRGNLFLTEESARYDGCTHRPCPSCNKMADKGWTLCRECLELKAKNAYDTAPSKEWDGDSPLYSGVTGEYYRDLEDIYDYELDPKELRLYICEKEYASPIDTSIWSDSLSVDEDHMHDALEELVDEFNEKLEKLDHLSWVSTKYKAVFEVEDEKV